MGNSLAFGRSPPSAEEVVVHSLEEEEEEEGEVGRLQVNQEGEAVVVGAVDHYLGAAVGVVAVLLCCPAEGEEVVAEVLRDLGEEVEVEEDVAEVPQPSGAVQWRPG